MNEDTTSWSESRRLILSELDRMEKAITALSGKIDDLRENGRDGLETLRKEYDQRFSTLNVMIAMLQTKIAVGAAILSVATSLLVSWFVKGH